MSWALSWSLMGLKEVENGEQEYPDKVNEVPEKTGNFDAVGVALGIGFPHAGERTPDEENHDGAADDVQGVQARQREINGGVGVVPRAVVFHVFDVGLLDGDFHLRNFAFLPGVGHLRLGGL